MTTDERIMKLETENKTIFHQIDELKDNVADIHKIATSIEVIAHENKNISEKVDKIDGRITVIENQPKEAFKHIKQTIIACVITGIASALIAALMAVIMK